MPHYEERIFLESTMVAAEFLGAGHIYLVRRTVLVQDDGSIVNELTGADQVLRGGVFLPIPGFPLIVNTSNLADSRDVYGAGETPLSRRSLDITSQVLGGGKYSSVQAAWTGMKAYVDGIGSAAYIYEYPDGEDNHLANSGATILSALNNAGVDARDLPRHDGAPGKYLESYFSNHFPGASNSSDPTLLGSATTDRIEASQNLTSGVVLLGRTMSK